MQQTRIYICFNDMYKTFVEKIVFFFLNSHVNVMNIKENIEYLHEYKKKICDFSKNKN